MSSTWIIGFVAIFAEMQSLWWPFIILNGLQVLDITIPKSSKGIGIKVARCLEKDPITNFFILPMIF